jgi:hypothetical protein
VPLAASSAGAAQPFQLLEAATQLVVLVFGGHRPIALGASLRRGALVTWRAAMAGFLPLGREGIPIVPLIGLLLAALGAVAVSPEVLLVLAPAFMLLGLLFMGQAPGERLLLRFARRPRRPRRRCASVPRPRLPLVVRRVGRLIASALAMRPPPRTSAPLCR